MTEQQFFDIGDLYPLSYLDSTTRLPCSRVRRVYQFALLNGATALQADVTVAPA